MSNIPRPSSSGRTVDGLRTTAASGEERDSDAAVLATTEPALEPVKLGPGVAAVAAAE
jgi:hypothetical protein